MNWTKTPPTQEGWYYLREDERDDWCIVEVWPKVDGGFFIGDGKDVADINALGYEWGGRVPAPGTNFAVEEIREWILGELIYDGNGNEPKMFKEKNRHTRFLAGYLDDKEDGIAATTARHRKEQV